VGDHGAHVEVVEARGHDAAEDGVALAAGLALEEDCAGGDEIDPVRAGGDVGGREAGVGGGGVFGDEEGGRGGADEETARRRDIGD